MSEAEGVRYEVPPISTGPGALAPFVADAVRLAKEKPGSWVLCREYDRPATATVTASRIREKNPDIETTCRHGRVYIRVAKTEGGISEGRGEF